MLVEIANQYVYMLMRHTLNGLLSFATQLHSEEVLAQRGLWHNLAAPCEPPSENKVICKGQGCSATVKDLPTLLTYQQPTLPEQQRCFQNPV